MGSGVFEYAVLIQVAVSMQRCDGPFCDEIAFRCGAEFGMQRAGDVGHRGLNLANHLGTLAFEPLSHVVRRLCNQLLEKVPGDVLTQTKLFGENGGAFGTFDHVQKAEARETRTVIICDRVHTLPVAARHEHVGDRVLEGFSFRDREQMRLTFGAGVGNQGFGVEPPGLPEDGARDFDRIVKGEFVDDMVWSIVSPGQPPCKLGAGRNFNLIGKAPNTSPKVHISSSLYRPAINKSVACHNARARLSGVPREIASSRSCRKDFDWLILAGLKSTPEKPIRHGRWRRQSSTSPGQLDRPAGRSPREAPGWLAGAECRAVRPALPRPINPGFEKNAFNP